jgi:hypothetical protein
VINDVNDGEQFVFEKVTLLILLRAIKIKGLNIWKIFEHSKIEGCLISIDKIS